MPNSLNPAFFKLNYHSNAGPHTATVPTLLWNVGNTFDTWNAGTVDEITMIEGYVDKLLPFFASDTEFDNWVTYLKPPDPADPQPVSSGSFTGKVGTASSPGWTTAVQGTFSIRTHLFGIYKIVMLDGASGNSFAPSSALGGAALDLFNYVSDKDNGFSGQDNGRPNVFIKFTKTLNEKLRRAYRLT
jgi:hypothetical protein